VRLLPLVVVWGIQVAVAPLSSHLTWQLARHHHGAIACAWILAVAALATVAHSRVRGGLAYLLPLLLLVALPFWSVEHARAALALHERNGEVARLLTGLRAEGEAAGRGPSVLLLNDAGLLSLAHDGPMVDALGLGTPGLSRPSMHGPGAMLETLARRRPLPEMAALNLDLVPLGALLGPPVGPESVTVAVPVAGTEFRRVRRDLLRQTPLAGRGVDFGFLPDEARWLRWRETPDPNRASFAIGAATPRGEPQLHGCRALYGTALVLLPPGTTGARLRTISLQEASALTLRGGDGIAPITAPLAELQTVPDVWAEIEIPVPPGTEALWLRREGGLPCLESLEFAGTLLPPSGGGGLN
jgi:hypothetical protein